MESDAYLLGVDSNTYWCSTPKLIIDICNKKIEQLTLEKEEQLEIAKYQSYLTMVGFHNPKKFPTDNNKKPASNKVMDDKVMELNIIALKNMYG